MKPLWTLGLLNLAGNAARDDVTGNGIMEFAAASRALKKDRRAHLRTGGLFDYLDSSAVQNGPSRASSPTTSDSGMRTTLLAFCDFPKFCGLFS